MELVTISEVVEIWRRFKLDVELLAGVSSDGFQFVRRKQPIRFITLVLIIESSDAKIVELIAINVSSFIRMSIDKLEHFQMFW